MSKWSFFTVLLCASFSSSSLSAQWTQAGGMTPQQSQYPQSQYPQDSAQEDPTQADQNIPAQGQPSQPQPMQQGSPVPDPADLQHGAARVSITQGDVNIGRGDNGQLTGAVINTPLIGHDHVETSGGSRAEIQLDAVTLVRLAPNTDIGFADLEYHRAQIQLGLGSILFRILQVSPTQVEIDTPSVGFRAVAPGEYRISVFDNGTSQITVHTGQGEILAPGGTERLDAGRSVMIRGDAGNPEMQDVSANARDQFDDWSAGRDQELAASQSTQYVNTDVQGASDLDHYGSWVPSGYGQVWQPQGVSQDWSPYSNGQWAYTDYYGWSWIDAAPWGWAPYHYGRWFFNTGYGWCWWPGSRAYPAYYSPALVSFFGFGGGIGVGFGALGWVALAPFEFCHPWWGGRGFGYRGYGLASYRNAGFRGGVLSASFNSFGAGHQRFGFATHDQIRAANAIAGRLPVTNYRAAMNYSGRAAVANSRFASVPSRSFYNSGQGRSFGGGPVNSGRSAVSGSANLTTRSAASSSGGWQRFGTPGVSSATHSNFQGSESSGWHNFGAPLAGTNRSYQSSPSPYSARSSPSAIQPRSNYSSPSSSPRSFSQPQSSYQQPRSNSYSYSAPRQSYRAPAQNYSAPRQQSGSGRGSSPEPHNGGGHSNGGGGHSSGNSGGGHHR